ncbi:MAG TPA: tetratricopeptide repeat protein [Terricaulis sp.]|nr:tetratricopeptide repeat protein [Terricaulis sp.]
MTDHSAPSSKIGRLAACIAAAGLVFAPAAWAQTQLPPPSYGQADARQDRIEELESQLRAATAENERLQYELMQAQREMQRLQNMVGQLSSVNQSLSTPENPPSEGAAPAPQPDQRSQQQAPAPQQQGTLGTLPADQLPGDAGLAYSRARELLVADRLAEAEAAFEEFLRRFPDADTAADARFWFGRTLLARNNHADAAASFVQYLERWPRGPRAPDAQLYLGMSLVGMGEARRACSAFRSLPTRYANASAEVRRLAAREAAANNCAA